jgi:predicted acetyltransferase
MCQMCELSFVGFAEPQPQMLASYVEALQQGWSPHSEADVSQQQLAAIAADADRFLAGLADVQPAGQTRTLDDGLIVPVLPQRIRWIWDGAFCGTINLRWQPGSNDLPDWFLGHIGYTVVPWKRNHGYAQRALRHMLSEAREVGLSQVELSTPVANVISQRVITANGGILLRTLAHPRFDAAIQRHVYGIDLSAPVRTRR